MIELIYIVYKGSHRLENSREELEVLFGICLRGQLDEKKKNSMRVLLCPAVCLFQLGTI